MTRLNQKPSAYVKAVLDGAQWTMQLTILLSLGCGIIGCQSPQFWKSQSVPTGPNYSAHSPMIKRGHTQPHQSAGTASEPGLYVQHGMPQSIPVAPSAGQQYRQVGGVAQSGTSTMPQSQPGMVNDPNITPAGYTNPTRSPAPQVPSNSFPSVQPQ